ncbi:MAG: transaldolase [Planctomycetes bacterium]|nr:transaldolase [Planctomycetota bacterium]
MSIFVDTAKIEQAKASKGFGWVSGITTNPTLIAQSGDSAEDTIRQLAELNTGLLFYQLVATSIEDMIKEADLAKKIVGDQLVLKIPPTEKGFGVIPFLPSEIPCCITALYSVAQAIVACELEIRYIAVYVNRATRLLGDGMGLLHDMSKVLKGSQTQILAASIKSPAEASAAILSGANHLTLPFDVLRALTAHEYSDEAVQQFNAEGSGIKIPVF